MHLVVHLRTDLHFTECRFPDGFVPIHVLLKLKKLRSLIIEVVDMHDDVLKAGLRVELFELAVSCFFYSNQKQ